MVTKVKINYCGDSAPLYATEGAAGADLKASLAHPIILKCLERILIPSGVSIELPVGYEGQVRSRSGLSYKQGLVVLNSPGTIDSDYRGEIMVSLINLDADDVIIKPGMSVAQLVISPVVQVEFCAVTSLSSTERGSSGFGSTGQ